MWSQTDKTTGTSGGIYTRIKRHLLILRGRTLLLLAGGVGLVLLLLGTCQAQNKENAESVGGEMGSCEIYRTAYEAEAESLCEKVKGAGACKVSLTFESGESYTYSGSRVTSVTPPKVCGVAVVCEGGESDTVRRELTELLATLYHIGANRVHISPMK